jgi:hypothetical protein
MLFEIGVVLGIVVAIVVGVLARDLRFLSFNVVESVAKDLELENNIISYSMQNMSFWCGCASCRMQRTSKGRMLYTSSSRRS